MSENENVNNFDKNLVLLITTNNLIISLPNTEWSPNHLNHIDMQA